MKRIIIELPDHFPLARIADAISVLGIGQIRYRCCHELVATHPEAHSNQNIIKVRRKAAIYKAGILDAELKV